MIMMDEIIKALNSDDCVVGIFLDFSKALVLLIRISSIRDKNDIGENSFKNLFLKLDVIVMVTHRA